MSLRVQTSLLNVRLPSFPFRPPTRALPPISLRSSQISRSSVRPASRWGPQPRYNRFQQAQGFYQLWQTNPAFRYGVGAVGVGGGVFYYTNLERVPISGRLRFNCMSMAFEEQQAQHALQGVMQEFHGKVLPPDHPNSRLVNRVLRRLIPASGMEDLKWEVRVIDDPEQKNAFVLPGGKVFVFSGILSICGGEDGLAAVLGHEISHQLAHHTSEQMSGMIWVYALSVLMAYTFDISANFSQQVVDLALSRPNSRKMESEADFIGLLMMAKACYDPKAAIGLWQRMAEAEKGAPPQFLSTHPASKNRMTTIQKWLPEAEEKRSQSDCGSTIGFADQFREIIQHSDEGFW